MPLSFAAICPHPPIIIPGVGSKEDLSEVSKTIEAMHDLAEKFDEKKVKTVIVITPHGKIMQDKFLINYSDKYKASLPGVSLDFAGDTELSAKISNLKSVAKKESQALNHGVAVPLYYFKKRNPKIKIIPINYSFQDREKHFEFGKKLFQLLKKENKNVAVIASGDLSHKLKPGAPAGFSEKGREFDEKILNLIQKKQAKKILQMDKELIEEAGQCGYRSILVILGLVDNISHEPEELSYEGPFGVGYAVVNYNLKENED